MKFWNLSLRTKKFNFYKKRFKRILKLELAYHASKFSGEWPWTLNLVSYSDEWVRFLKIVKNITKFTLSKRGTRGLEFCFAGSQLQGRHEVRPLIPLFKSSKPFARSKCMQLCFALHAFCVIESQTNFKISWTSNFGSKIWAKR